MKKKDKMWTEGKNAASVTSSYFPSFTASQEDAPCAVDLAKQEKKIKKPFRLGAYITTSLQKITNCTITNYDI